MAEVALRQFFNMILFEIFKIEVWLNYKLEAKSLFAAAINGAVLWASGEETLGQLMALAAFASPLVSILTCIILLFTLMKMIDRFVESKYKFSVFTMRKLPDEKSAPNKARKQ